MALPFILLIKSDLIRDEEGIFESLFIGIKSVWKDLAVGLIYRSPSGSIPSLMKILEMVLDKEAFLWNNPYGRFQN